jgi:PAS domain S-box-containing protein
MVLDAKRDAASGSRPVGASRRVGASSVGRQLLAALCLGVAYYVTGFYGIMGKVPPADIAAIWPPSAVLLAALLASPRERWWQHFAVVVPVHVFLFLQCLPEMKAATLTVQTVGYMAQAGLAAEWLRRVEGTPLRLDTLRSVTRFVLIGVLAVPMLTAGVVVYIYTLTGWATSFEAVWRQRVLSNVVALLPLTPFIVVMLSGDQLRIRHRPPLRYLEFGALTLAMCAVVAGVFGWKITSSQATPALMYALLPLLIWAAVRFEPGGLYASLVLITFGSLFGAYNGRGPFLTLSQPENVIALQLFLIAMSVPLMLLTALVQERSRAAKALRESQTRYSMATAAGASGVWDWNLRTGALYIDPGLKSQLGFLDHEIQNTMDAWAARVHPDDRPNVLGATERYLSGESRSLEVEHRIIHKDGSVRWFLCRGITTEFAGGVPVRMVGTDTDITELKASEHALQRSHERVREMAGRLISAQEEERRRIARDLHDDLNQKVAGLSIQLSNVRQRIPPSEQHLIRELSQLQARTADLVHDIRELSHDIHPSILEHGGIAPALTAFAAELSRVEGFQLRLSLPDQAKQVPPGVTIAIYRIAQEAIRNVLRHAGTHSADISLDFNGGGLTLLIRDQGRGFDTDRVRESGGLGLISIEERVRLLDGRLDLSSRHGQGTTLRIEVPMAQSAVA